MSTPGHGDGGPQETGPSTPGGPAIGHEALARDYTAWIGGTRVYEEVLDPGRSRALAATLDRDPAVFEDGGALPPVWHWIHFQEPVRASDLGPDGHEKLGAFLPDVPLPRRMWAGGRLRFHGPLRLGAVARKESTVASVTPKHGKTGPLVFVTVRHALHGPGGLVVEEEQDIVYREAPSGEGGVVRGGRGWATPEDARVVGGFRADEITLFRFSALTFNSHRIHYDHRYATGVEGYPGLVVHGPLLALLLAEAGAHALGEAGLRFFEYRALAPLFCGEAVELVADSSPARRQPDPHRSHPHQEVQLWAVHPERGPVMRASARSDLP